MKLSSLSGTVVPSPQGEGWRPSTSAREGRDPPHYREVGGGIYSILFVVKNWSPGKLGTLPFRYYEVNMSEGTLLTASMCHTRSK